MERETVGARRVATPLGFAGRQPQDSGWGCGWLLFATRRVGWGERGREDSEGTSWKGPEGDVVGSEWAQRWEGDSGWEGVGGQRTRTGRGGAS